MGQLGKVSLRVECLSRALNGVWNSSQWGSGWRCPLQRAACTKVLWQKEIHCGRGAMGEGIALLCLSTKAVTVYILFIPTNLALTSYLFSPPAPDSHSNWIYDYSLIQETLCCNVSLSQMEVFSFFGELAFAQFMPGILVINCITSFLILGLNSPVQKCTTLRPCPSFALAKQYSWVNRPSH